MPRPDEYRSVSLPVDFVERVKEIGPRIGARPQDGRRSDSTASYIVALVELGIKALEAKPRQAPLVLYDDLTSSRRSSTD